MIRIESLFVATMSKPYEWMAWGGTTAPSEEQLDHMLVKEGLSPVKTELPPGKSQEMRFDQAVVWVLVEGKAYFGMPGYGSVDMAPGDIMEIEAGLMHDITVTSGSNSRFLQAFRA